MYLFLIEHHQSRPVFPMMQFSQHHLSSQADLLVVEAEPQPRLTGLRFLEL